MKSTQQAAPRVKEKLAVQCGARLLRISLFFYPQIRVDGNNERSVQHSSGGRGGPSSSQGSLSGSGEGQPRHHHQRPTRDRGMKKEKQDAPALVNGVS